MGFASDTGYVPLSVNEIIDICRLGINEQFGTTYTAETFIGSNWYKFAYAWSQRVQENEIKTSEIFLRMQQYFSITNEKVFRPNTTHSGIIDYFGQNGFLVSTKPPNDTDAGKLFICVDVTDNHALGKATITNYANLVSGTDDSITVGATVFTAQVGTATPGAGTFQAATSNVVTAQSLAAQINAHATAGVLVHAEAQGAVVYIRAIAGGTAGNSIALVYTDNDTNVGATVSGATLTGGRVLTTDEADYDTTKLVIANLVKNVNVGGVVTQGDQIITIALSNGQSFDYKFCLPNRIPVKLRLTITTSENNLFTILDPAVTKANLIANIDARYKLGKNFEPQRYFSVVDAPWASMVLLEWSTDGGSTWSDDVYDSAFDDLFTFEAADVSIVEV